MGREPQTETIEGLEVTSTPLTFECAEPLLPDVGQFLALLLRELPSALASVDLGNLDKLDLKTIDVSKIAPVLHAVTSYFGEGKLSKMAPKILAGTTVLFPDPFTGEKEVKDLAKAKDRAAVFDEYPSAYLPIVFFAGRSTFLRFFPGLAQRGDGTPSGSS